VEYYLTALLGIIGAVLVCIGARHKLYLMVAWGAIFLAILAYLGHPMAAALILGVGVDLTLVGVMNRPITQLFGLVTAITGISLL